MLHRILGAFAAIALTASPSIAQTTNPAQRPDSGARDVIRLRPLALPATVPEKPKPSDQSEKGNSVAPPASEKEQPRVNVVAAVESARQQLKALEGLKSGCAEASTLRTELRNGRMQFSMAEDEGEWRAAVTNLRHTIDKAAALRANKTCGTEPAFAESATAVGANLASTSTALKDVLTRGEMRSMASFSTPDPGSALLVCQRTR